MTVIVDLFNSLSFSFMHFWSSGIRLITKCCYVLLMNWPCYHYEIPYFHYPWWYSLLGSLCVWCQYSHSSFYFFISVKWFQPFTFNIFASLCLNCISYRSHVSGSCFVLQSGNLCLLLVFNMIIYTVTLNLSCCSLFSICPIYSLFLFFSSTAFFWSILKFIYRHTYIHIYIHT